MILDLNIILKLKKLLKYQFFIYLSQGVDLCSNIFTQSYIQTPCKPFGNEELGKNVRQAHRQNYRDLSIRYPHISLNVIFVYHIDDTDIGHNDVYKHDFWLYPWPDGLVLKLAKYPKTLILSKNSDIIRHLGNRSQADRNR